MFLTPIDLITLLTAPIATLAGVLQVWYAHQSSKNRMDANIRDTPRIPLQSSPLKDLLRSPPKQFSRRISNPLRKLNEQIIKDAIKHGEPIEVKLWRAALANIFYQEFLYLSEATRMVSKESISRRIGSSSISVSAKGNQKIKLLLDVFFRNTCSDERNFLGILGDDDVSKIKKKKYKVYISPSYLVELLVFSHMKTVFGIDIQIEFRIPSFVELGRILKDIRPEYETYTVGVDVSAFSLLTKDPSIPLTPTFMLSGLRNKLCSSIENERSFFLLNRQTVVVPFGEEASPFDFIERKAKAAHARVKLDTVSALPAIGRQLAMNSPNDFAVWSPYWQIYLMYGICNVPAVGDDIIYNSLLFRLFPHGEKISEHDALLFRLFTNCWIRLFRNNQALCDEIYSLTSNQDLIQTVRASAGLEIKI